MAQILELRKCDLCDIQVLNTSLERIAIQIPVEGQDVTVPNLMACRDCRKEIEDAGKEVSDEAST